ncbi:MAG TPA: hypothetical protein VM008_06655 [Phycisphaerae bacterium]|nr:hypothetical protein [Phycisphaerae bacterium]
MSDRIQRFCDGLKVRIDAIGTSIGHAKRKLSSATAKAEGAVWVELEEAWTRVAARYAQLSDMHSLPRSGQTRSSDHLPADLVDGCIILSFASIT